MPTTAGTSITWSSGRNGSVPSFRRFTICVSRRSEVSEAMQVDGGLRVERTAAPGQRIRLRVDRRVGVEVEQHALDLLHGLRAGAGRRAAPSGPRRARSSSAGSTTARRRASRSASREARSPRRARRGRAASRAGSASSVPLASVTYAARSQVRWLSPTWPSVIAVWSTPSRLANRRWNPMATLQSPTAR